MKTSDQYTKYVSTHYDHLEPATRESYRRRFYVWRSYLEHLLPTSKDSALLEIGCGVGHNLYALKELGYQNLIGTDFAKECVDECIKHGFDVRLVNDESEKIFYKTNEKRFDCIIFYDVVEHYDPVDAKKILEMVKTLLKPKGSVIISLPNANHPFSNTLLFADITHKFIYNTASLSQLLRSSGYREISLMQMNSWTTYDDSIFIRFIKNTLLLGIAWLGELFWKAIALSQGIILPECKPTLIARAS